MSQARTLSCQAPNRRKQLTCYDCFLLLPLDFQAEIHEIWILLMCEHHQEPLDHAEPLVTLVVADGAGVGSGSDDGVHGEAGVAASWN